MPCPLQKKFKKKKKYGSKYLQQTPRDHTQARIN